MNNGSDAAGGLVALFSGGIFLVSFLIGYIVVSFALMTIANKLNVQNSWLAWIPIANLYLMTQCAGLEWWWMLLCFIPYVGVFPAIWIWWKITEARGKPGPLSLVLLIPCVNLGYILYLAFAD